MEAIPKHKQPSITKVPQTAAAAAAAAAAASRQHIKNTQQDLSHRNSKIISIRIDKDQHVPIKPSPFASRFYAPVDCAIARFPNIKNRRSLHKQNYRVTRTADPSACNVTRMADPSLCDRGHFPFMCDFNKNRLPQRITMVDCGRCNSDGKRSGTNVMCLTVDGNNGTWIPRELKINLPFKIGNEEYIMRKQVITVGCYCNPFTT